MITVLYFGGGCVGGGGIWPTSHRPFTQRWMNATKYVQSHSLAFSFSRITRCIKIYQKLDSTWHNKNLLTQGLQADCEKFTYYKITHRGGPVGEGTAKMITVLYHNGGCQGRCGYPNDIMHLNKLSRWRNGLSGKYISSEMGTVTQPDNRTDCKVFWGWTVAYYISGERVYLSIFNEWMEPILVYCFSGRNRWNFSVGMWRPTQCNIKRKVSTLILSR